MTLQIIVEEAAATTTKPSNALLVNVLQRDEETGLRYLRRDVPISFPFAREDVEEDLEWLMESSEVEASYSTSRLYRARVRLNLYGKELFRQVFSDCLPKTCASGHLHVLIRGGVELQSLHWETLYDDERGPVALDRMRSMTRVIPRPIDHVGRVPMRRSTTLNIMFLTARVFDETRDIPLRAESLAILNEARTRGLPIRVDVVRPGCKEALIEKLKAREKTPGYYHVLHLDCHGSGTVRKQGAPRVDEFLREYCRYDSHDASDCAFPSRNLSKQLSRDGARDKKKATLVFERQLDGGKEEVSAETIAEYVRRFRIPIVLTSACRSAYATSSFAHSLFEKSCASYVIAFSYDVLWATSTRFSTEFYRSLLNGLSVRDSTTAARRHMAEDQRRNGLKGTTVEKVDWWVPICYGDGDVRFEHVLAARSGSSPGHRRKMSHAKDEALYVYRRNMLNDWIDVRNFVGFDNDLLRVEAKVFIPNRCNVLSVHGIRGGGKSAFLSYLSWWWCVVGLTERKFYFSFKTARYSVQDIVHQIQEYNDSFDESAGNHAAVARSARTIESLEAVLGGPTERSMELLRHKVTKRLCRERNILVLDDVDQLSRFECPQHCAFAYRTSRDATRCDKCRELEETFKDLTNWLAELNRGQTLVFIGSRRPEEELLNEIAAGGTDGKDMSQLFDSIPNYSLPHMTQKDLESFAHSLVDELPQPPAERQAIKDTTGLFDIMGGNPGSVSMAMKSLRGVSGTSHQNLIEESAGSTLARLYEDKFRAQLLERDVQDCAVHAFGLPLRNKRAMLLLSRLVVSVSQDALDCIGVCVESAHRATPLSYFEPTDWPAAIDSARDMGVLKKDERVNGERGSFRIHPAFSLLRFATQSAADGNTTQTFENTCSTEPDWAEEVLYQAYYRLSETLLRDLWSDNPRIQQSALRTVSCETENLRRAIMYSSFRQRPFFRLLSILALLFSVDSSIDRLSDLCAAVEDNIERLGAATGSEPSAFVEDVCKLRIMRARIGFDLGNLAGLDTLMQTCMSVCRGRGLHELELLCRLQYGRIELCRNSPRSADRMFRDVYSRTKLVSSKRRALYFLGCTRLAENDPEDALRLFNDSKNSWNGAHISVRACTLHYLAICYLLCDYHAKARQCCIEAIGLWRTNENGLGRALSLQLLGLVAASDSESGAASKAEDIMLLSLRMLEGVDRGPHKLAGHHNLCVLLEKNRVDLCGLDKYPTYAMTEIDEVVQAESTARQCRYPNLYYNLAISLYEDGARTDTAIRLLELAASAAPEPSSDADVGAREPMSSVTPRGALTPRRYPVTAGLFSRHETAIRARRALSVVRADPSEAGSSGACELRPGGLADDEDAVPRVFAVPRLLP